jgi:hypothetical protein
MLDSRDSCYATSFSSTADTDPSCVVGVGWRRLASWRLSLFRHRRLCG